MSCTCWQAAPTDRRDPTPAAGAQRGKPAKGLTQEWRPAFTVVALLLVAGLVVGIVLWTSMNFGGGDPAPPATALPQTESSTAANAGPADVPAVVGAATIATITAYDPDGEDGENDSDAVLSFADSNAATSWTTSCYSSQFMGGKQGVGLVVSFSDLAQQAITVDVQTGPYQVDFFATDAETIPASFDGWGPALGSTAFANEPEALISPVPATPARHVLILLKEIGRDSTCSDANPFRGRLGEIAIVG